VLATIGFQALINMLVVTGLAPTKGIALPLVSRGGTGWMLTCLSLGLLMAMDRAMQREDQRVGELSAGSVGGSSVDAPAEACGGSENAPAPAA
jgi:cell division protein FtsW